MLGIIFLSALLSLHLDLGGVESGQSHLYCSPSCVLFLERWVFLILLLLLLYADDLTMALSLSTQYKAKTSDRANIKRKSDLQIPRKAKM